ncbi:MAG: 1-acyl-sn-glycerol-3-phosphate acyltransferase [Ruminococcus sp.]|nr:1-acyl-sn-glycerol-3-phosphate acyltransferase [Ruminococcus sp.]
MFCLYKIMRSVLAPVFTLLYRPRIIGAENIPKSGAAVIAGNHKHALDPILIDISTKRVVRTLAKKELHDGPFGGMFRSVGTIPVDLHADHNHDAFITAVEALEEGQLVNVSPEAKRNYTDQLLLPFKFGAAAMAGRTGAVIVPYAITGEYRLFARNRLTVVFGRPMTASEDADRTNEKLYGAVAFLLRRSMPKEQLSAKFFTSYREWRSNEKTS